MNCKLVAAWRIWWDDRVETIERTQLQRKAALYFVNLETSVCLKSWLEQTRQVVRAMATSRRAGAKLGMIGLWRAVHTWKEITADANADAEKLKQALLKMFAGAQRRALLHWCATTSEMAKQAKICRGANAVREMIVIRGWWQFWLQEARSTIKGNDVLDRVAKELENRSPDTASFKHNLQ